MFQVTICQNGIPMDTLTFELESAARNYAASRLVLGDNRTSATVKEVECSEIAKQLEYDRQK